MQVDAEPYIIEDEVGLQLVAPHEGWQQRPDMHQEFTKRLRASMVARARFIIATKELEQAYFKNRTDHL